MVRACQLLFSRPQSIMSAFNDVFANFLGSPAPWDLQPIPENLLFLEAAINSLHRQQVSGHYTINRLRIHREKDDTKKIERANSP